MKKNLLILGLIGLVSLFFAGCVTTNTEPQTVNITLRWTAVGDDGMEGTASSYELRTSTDSTELINDWNNCQLITGLSVPQAPLTPEVFSFNQEVNLETNYYYRLKVEDNVGLYSLSNIANRYFPDTIPPAQVLDLR